MSYESELTSKMVELYDCLESSVILVASRTGTFDPLTMEIVKSEERTPPDRESTHFAANNLLKIYKDASSLLTLCNLYRKTFPIGAQLDREGLEGMESDSEEAIKLLEEVFGSLVKEALDSRE